MEYNAPGVLRFFSLFGLCVCVAFFVLPSICSFFREVYHLYFFLQKTLFFISSFCSPMLSFFGDAYPFFFSFKNRHRLLLILGLHGFLSSHKNRSVWFVVSVKKSWWQAAGLVAGEITRYLLWPFPRRQSVVSSDDTIKSAAALLVIPTGQQAAVTALLGFLRSLPAKI